MSRQPFVTVALIPGGDSRPRLSYSPATGDEIPSINLADGTTNVLVQFDQSEPELAIWYLRRLAAAASELANAVQNHTGVKA